MRHTLQVLVCISLGMPPPRLDRYCDWDLDCDWGRQRLLDTSHGSHTWIFIGIVNKIFTHMRILLLHSAKIITKKGGEKEIKAEDLRGQGCVCICPEHRVGAWEFWGLVHYCIVGWAWCIPCCRISCRFAIKMLSMPKNYAMLWHPSGQSTIYMRIQFDFQYS